MTNTFEKVVDRLPFVLAYEIETVLDVEPRIVILHVIHGARDWPPDRWPVA